jgi:hypothetical protein
MVDDKTLLKLKDIKIRLLENYIQESKRISDLYGWLAEPDDTEELKNISRQILDMEEYTNNVNKEGNNTS